MSFKTSILKRLHSLMTKEGLALIEQSENKIRYESDELMVSLVHNPREKSNTLWISKKYQQEIAIDDYLLQEFFQSDIRLDNLPKDGFLNNGYLFFESVGNGLLKRGSNRLIELEKYNELRSERYTSELVDQQNLEAANNAWEEKNYSAVIKYLDMIKPDNLPESYKKKYKIATEKNQE